MPPYISERNDFNPEDSFTDGDIQNLVDWGFNFVRLGVMWEAVEREPGKYNDTYLEEVNSLVDRLGAKGIYTMVDAHQDVYARKICGEGIPNFYAKQILDEGPTYCIDPRFDFILEPILKVFGYCKPLSDYDLSADENGNPKISDCQKYDFIRFFTSPEARTIQRALYNNDFGIRDKFVSSWKHVALKLSSNKNILAYDPLNEPEPTSSTIFEWVWNWLPGHLDRTMIQPFYTRIFKAYS